MQYAHQRRMTILSLQQVSSSSRRSCSAEHCPIARTFSTHIWHCSVSILLMCLTLLELSLLSLTIIHVGISIRQGGDMCTVRGRQRPEERSMSLRSQKG